MAEIITPEIIVAIMLGGVLVGVMIGYPLGLVIGSLGFAIGCMLWGVNLTFQLYYIRIFEILLGYSFLAVPLFVFMGLMLEQSGIADILYDALYLWFGRLPGGLAVTTILLGTVLAACVGVIGASVSMLALVALPAMIKRGYSKDLACGTVAASGCLGILIPPSIMFIIYGPLAEISVGKLFMGAIFPGLLLSALYCLYVIAKCKLHPNLAPTLPADEARIPLSTKLKKLIFGIIPTVLIVASVLGTIFWGIAPPTEAGAMGGFATILLCAAYRKLTWKALAETALGTFKISSMILLIGCMSFAFVGVFLKARGGGVVERIILSTPGGEWGAFFAIMFVVFILGFIIDWIAILFIMAPILTPVVKAMGFDPLWFALMVCLNLQTSFMTPPFASAIFYLKGCTSPEMGITMADMFKGVIPFVILILVGLILCVAYPEILLWLPGKMIR
jgi:tripartite ATP-independent transporter DctM subunit